MDKIKKIKNYKREFLFQIGFDKYYLNEQITKELHNNYIIYIYDCYSYGLRSRPYIIIFSLHENYYVYTEIFSTFEKIKRSIPIIKNEIVNFVNSFKTMDIE